MLTYLLRRQESCPSQSSSPFVFSFRILSSRDYPLFSELLVRKYRAEHPRYQTSGSEADLLGLAELRLPGLSFSSVAFRPIVGVSKVGFRTIPKLRMRWKLGACQPNQRPSFRHLPSLSAAGYGRERDHVTRDRCMTGPTRT